MVKINLKEKVCEFEHKSDIKIVCNNCFQAIGNYLSFISNSREEWLVYRHHFNEHFQFYFVNDDVYCKCNKLLGEQLIINYFAFFKKAVVIIH